LAKRVPSSTVEDYLLAIYNLNFERVEVIAARLADKLDVSAPTVSVTVERMVRDGYVDVADNHAITLTESGQVLGERVARRHRLIERWLNDMLDLDWVMLHEEAHRLEHSLSSSLEQKISEALNHPETCPHGNPIPGNAKNWSFDGMKKLSESRAGEQVKVVRISELAEDDAELMLYLQQKNLVPGTHVKVQEITPFDHVVLKVEGETAVIDPEIAIYVWTRSATPPN
jgi:DtxR family Mn-dependent transcriptional regulator